MRACLIALTLLLAAGAGPVEAQISAIRFGRLWDGSA